MCELSIGYDPVVVALLAEGVDRNLENWKQHAIGYYVALLAEGVDRNGNVTRSLGRLPVALLAESVDRNRAVREDDDVVLVSPSSRRAWIEIVAVRHVHQHTPPSPSSRRAWIEISVGSKKKMPARSRPPRGGRG